MINHACQCGTGEVAMRFWLPWDGASYETLEVQFLRVCDFCTDPDPQYCDLRLGTMYSWEMGIEPFLYEPEDCAFSTAQELAFDYALNHNFDLLSYDIRKGIIDNQYP
jgi:hypothetical protein